MSRTSSSFTVCVLLAKKCSAHHLTDIHLVCSPKEKLSWRWRSWTPRVNVWRRKPGGAVRGNGGDQQGALGQPLPPPNRPPRLFGLRVLSGRLAFAALSSYSHYRTPSQVRCPSGGQVAPRGDMSHIAASPAHCQTQVLVVVRHLCNLLKEEHLLSELDLRGGLLLPMPSGERDQGIS